MTARPPAARCFTITGFCGSIAKNNTLPGQYFAISTTSGSAALSTAVPSFGNGFDRHALHAGQLVERFNVVESEVIAFADVGDDGHVAAIESQAGAQNSAASRFQHDGIDAGIHQQLSSALRTAAIAGFQAAVVKVNAFGARHADATAGLTDDVSDESRGRCLAVDAGDRRRPECGHFALRRTSSKQSLRRHRAR